jgi:predicted nucleotidyltransferase
MTAALLDFSLRPELALHARVVADVEAVAAPMGIAIVITGAFARDLHLQYRHGIDMQRNTEDIDFGLAVPDWGAFAMLKERLTASGAFHASATVAHRLRHCLNGLPVDLIPFGRIETSRRPIAWPPRGDTVMDVFGFREALAAAHSIVLSGNVSSRVVSLPGLALLKLICWQERHYQSPRKDAQDLPLILRHYLSAPNEARLGDVVMGWTLGEAFEYELTGPRMLGHDMRELLDDAGRNRVAMLLLDQIDPEKPGILPHEMNTSDPRTRTGMAERFAAGFAGSGLYGFACCQKRFNSHRWLRAVDLL